MIRLRPSSGRGRSGSGSRTTRRPRVRLMPAPVSAFVRWRTISNRLTTGAVLAAQRARAKSGRERAAVEAARRERRECRRQTRRPSTRCEHAPRCSRWEPPPLRVSHGLTSALPGAEGRAIRHEQAVGGGREEGGAGQAICGPSRVRPTLTRSLPPVRVNLALYADWPWRAQPGGGGEAQGARREVRHQRDSGRPCGELNTRFLRLLWPFRRCRRLLCVRIEPQFVAAGLCLV